MKKALSRPDGETAPTERPEKHVLKEQNVLHMSHMIDEILDRLSKIGHGQLADLLYEKLERPDDQTLPGIAIARVPSPAGELVAAAAMLHLARQRISEGRADRAIEFVANGVSMAVVHGAFVFHEDPMIETQRERGSKTGAVKRAVRNWYLKKAEASFGQDTGANRDVTQPVTKRKVSERAHRQMRDHRRLWMRGAKGDAAAARAFSRLSAPGYKKLLLGPWAREIPTRESLYSYYLDSLKRQQMEAYIESCARARDEYVKKTTD